MAQNGIKFTESDCKTVLEKYFNNNPVKLISFSLQPISEDVVGYMGEHLRLKINVINEEKPETLKFFVKTLISQETMAEFIKSGNMFNKEISCYEFLRECTGFSPIYYHSKPNEFIVLEDLCESGCSMVKAFHLDAKHLNLVLESVAKFHAASIVFEEKKSAKLGRRFKLVEEYPELLEEGMFRKDEDYLGYKYVKCGLKALQALVDLLPDDGLRREEFKAKLGTLVDRAFDAAKFNGEFRNVWCNGDLWTKNIMFEYEDGNPVNCKIFDFQLARYNPPAYDVIFIIYEATNKLERQRNLEGYLDYYYEALGSELELHGLDIGRILNRDEFDVTCNLVTPIVKVTKAIYASLSAIGDEVYRKISQDPKLYAQIIFGDRSEFVSNLFNESSNYQKVLTGFLEDLRDVVTHEKISIEDCYKITRQKLGTSNYDLLSYQLTPFSEKCGFLGEHFTLKITVREANKTTTLSFFVKSIPKEIGQKNYVISSDIFFKEMKLYLKIIPEITANKISLEGCSPTCYLGRLNDVLVFEDYSTQGYTTLSSRISFTFEIIQVVIKKLVKLHSSALIIEEKLSTAEQKFRLGTHYAKELREAFYNSNKPSLDANQALINGVLTQIDMFPDPDSKISTALFKKRAANAIHRLSKLTQPSTKYRNTLCHGDLWASNILLKFQDEKVIDCLIVDYQATRYNPPAHDLMGFLYLSTDRKFRSENLTKCMEFYYEEISKIFEENGIDVRSVLPYGEFEESCEDMKEFGAAQNLNHGHNIKMTGKQIKELFADHEYARQIMFEDRSPNIRKVCEADPVYKEILRESIKDFREVCENSLVLDF